MLAPYGEPLELGAFTPGPRGAYKRDRWKATIEGYRAWIGRTGSQQLAFTGESSWTPERRFARLFERLGSLSSMPRDGRFDLLVTLGSLGVYEMAAGSLQFGGENEATVAAKRIFGIGDVLLLDRRAIALAEAAGLPLGAFDLGLHNWGTGRRFHAGIDPASEPDPDVVDRVRDALGL